MFRFVGRTAKTGRELFRHPPAPASFACKCQFGHFVKTIQINQLQRFEVVKHCLRIMASSSLHSDSGHHNRLALEKSPYLLQHATNPVDWYPWGKEAFDKAKTEDKPIFLSVGYSTCHWCHVMERESFENEEIGRVLNENFVSIKVDREERPDVDRVYMTFIQATSGGGGWPMSVWLTPDLKPIVGGTYFPPDDRYYGRPGFKSILLNISHQWKTNKSEIEQQGTLILDALMKGTHVSEHGDQPEPQEGVVEKCYQMLEKSYDAELGGFGKAPKFPQPVNFNFLLGFSGNQPNTSRGKKALDMSLHTLKMMAKGGMHDHIAQGFHRYSTDKFWHVPHFEKMLYDQGQLAVAYLNAYQITKDDFYAEIAKDIFEYVSRDLSHPAGGFYSAEDADSLPTADSATKREGAFCVWTHDDIHSMLTEKVQIEGKGDLKAADVFCYHFDIMKKGNVDLYQDPHGELTGQNVLIVRGSLETTATHFGLSIDVTKSLIDRCCQILFDIRLKRPKPHLDNKMVAAWNGLMISGFARGGQVLGNKAYTQRAIKAAEFLRSHMYLEDEQVLLRSCYTSETDGVAQILTPICGFADDYSFVIRGLLDVYEACYEDMWLQWAEKLQTKQNELFWDAEGAGYFNSGDSDSSIVLRLKEDQDGAEPSANSVSAMNLLRLANMLDRPEWHNQASQLIRVFGDRLTQIPLAVPEMVCALMFLLSTPKQIIVVGDRGAEDTEAMLRAIHDRYLPNKVLLLTDGSVDSFLYSKLDLLKTLTKVDGKATAYVCENYSCSLPSNSVQDLQSKL